MVRYFIAAFWAYAAVATVNTCEGATPADSVGVVVKSGVRLIRHQVVPKENLYAVARRYRVPVAAVRQANPGLKTLTVGQIILIPAPVPVIGKTETPPKALVKLATASDKSTAPALFDEQGNQVHRVDRQQTLFSIARLYSVRPADLQKWNKLPDNKVYAHQTLIVKPPTVAIKPAVIVNIPAPALTPVKPESTVTKAPTVPIAPPQEVVRTDNTTMRRDDTIRTTAPRETYTRVTESGLAELISQGGLSNKYLALHKTAPIGSFLTVRNMMNNQAVSVRVIGKLPDIGANEKVVVKVSKRAFQRLGALDNRFLVEVQYETLDKTLSSNR